MACAPAAVFAVQAMGPYLVGEGTLDAQSLGAVIGLAYLVAALASTIAGRLVDRSRSGAWLVVVPLLSMGAVTALMYGTGAGVLAAVIPLSGLALAMANPSTNRVLAEWSGVRRARGMGIKQSGVALGQMLVGGTVPLLIPVVGSMGALVAIVGGCAVIALTVLGRTPQTGRGEPVRGGLLSTGLVPLFASVACLSIGTQVVHSYLPLFARGDFGFHPSSAGLFVSLTGGLGIVSRTLWTRVYARVSRRERVMTVALGGAVLSAGLLAAAGVTGSRGVLFLAVTAFSLFTFGIVAMIQLRVLELVPLEAVGKVSGWLGTCMFGGCAAGPVAAGLLVSRGVDYAVVWACVGAVLCLGLVGTLRSYRSARPSTR